MPTLRSRDTALEGSLSISGLQEIVGDVISDAGPLVYDECVIVLRACMRTLLASGHIVDYVVSPLSAYTRIIDVAVKIVHEDGAFYYMTVSTN